VGGWYKRYAQFVAFVMACGMTVLGNFDTLAIANSLMVDDKLREQMVAAAEQYPQADLSVKKEKELKELKEGPDKEKEAARLKTEIENINQAKNVQELCQGQSGNPKQCYDAQIMQISKLSSFGLPIGWKPDDPRTKFTPSRSDFTWLEKLFGWFITAIAVSLGAPFWFDVLNKFMNFRSTIKPQPTEQPQPATRQTDNKAPGVG
jgi:hypothetical protein